MFNLVVLGSTCLLVASGFRESHVHDVQITKEAPNYRTE